ncbi:acyl carrier protein, partial [Streptomyces nanshensis]
VDLPGGPGTAQAPAGAEADAALRERVLKLPPERRHDAVLEVVRTLAAGVLGQQDLDAVRGERPFRDLGFDSLAVVELRNRLGAATGLSLASTLVYDHPTPDDLATHVLGQLAPEDESGDGGEEARIRELLAAVPLTQLREIGVLEPLLQLADGNGTSGAPAPEDGSSSIDSMAVDDLVQAALEGPHTSQE